MRRKNLERAVVLGLLLSTSVYGSVWAENMGPVDDNTVLKPVYNEDVVIDSGTSNAIEIINAETDQKEINIITNEPLTSGNGSIEISSKQKGVYLNGSGSILLDSIGNNNITVDLKTIAADKNHGYGIHADKNSNGTIRLSADNNTIIVDFDANDPDNTNAVVNGIFADTDSNVNIELVANDGNNTVNSKGCAISNNGKGDITFTANGGNILNSGINSTIYVWGGSGNVNITGEYNKITSDNADQFAIKVESSGSVNVTALKGDNIIDAINVNGGGNVNITAQKGSNDISGYGNAVINSYNGTAHVESYEDNIITSKGSNTQALYTENKGKIELIANAGENRITGNTSAVTINTYQNIIKAKGNNQITGVGSGINSTNGGIDIISLNGGNTVVGGTYGVIGNANDQIKITASNGINNISSSNNNSFGIAVMNKSSAYLEGKINEIKQAYFGLSAQNSSEINLISTDKGNNINSQSYGIYTFGSSKVNLEANSGLNEVIAKNTGISSSDEGTQVDLTARGNSINAKTGINGSNNSQVTLTANALNNEITTTAYGIYANTISDVDLTAKENSNIIKSGNIDEKGFGNQTAIYALSGSNVNLTAANKNEVAGLVYAYGDGTTIDLNGVNDKSVYNSVLSSTGVNGAGGLTDITVVSALFADNKSKINLSGINNIQTYYDDPEDTHTSERAVWAYKGANINIDGLTTIKTYLYEKSPNSMDLAIAAGTATNLDFDTVNANNPEEGMAIVDIDYDSYTYDDNGVERTAVSSIEGDILAAYGGIVDVAPKSADTVGINITGNLLAGNNGDLTVNLGNGGVLTGRADDYGDANVEGTTHGAGKDNGGFFNPAFSSEIITGGEVNLTMGEGSTWNVTGQSWITELKTNGTINDTYIDLVNAKTDLNTNASALTIGTLNGDTTFHMNLDGNRSASDMLYIKNADGKYQIDLAKAVTNDDINKDGFDGLRFATVGTGSNVEFTVGSYDDGGAFNVEYTVDTDSYEGNTENTAYNSTTDGSANVEKPGNASVDDFFGLTNNAVEDDSEIATNGIMLMAENEEAADNAANANGGLDEVTNFKIIARADEELNDTGETILNMSRANYSNAIYMDRLNKRLGEARYINDDPEEDEGMWVRIRHDRIGKDDAYRSQNTMYELGYDKKQDCDNGERRVGFAVDYMHGDTGYTDIAGKGEIDRYGLWLYDTWMGDKGHYVDYVAKWGHLDNDFEVYTMRDGDKVTGDYSNNVFSVSAEYGRKKDIGNDWYFEPQAQLQLARVTGADYTTNQGTKVSVDGINSLIGRAGFRIGKDFGEEKQSTLYFKADVLHEFLGDQDVYVMDKSTDNKWAGISYDNEGTWYDIGIGYAAMMSKSSYAFIDLEQSFGNDNDDTYQINAGVRWTF